ncbi:uncharacterized protein At4g15545-like [Papaver somniferum]|uniref:uncharacterized protein At4g15545-like n=1 Tax=Papaver somniferum TaxID=3469 RepID=UPI000E6FCB34|nr:uncharacterized protein At4g15545-like [Papaver somniferum]
MLARESPSSCFDIPEEILSLLPSDPFEQLDIARKITSIALSARVAKLESESNRLKAKVEEKDDLISELQSQIETLDSALSETDRLTQIDQEKESLLKENESLSNTVKKLNRDVSKLEVFKKTLMQSLQEEEAPKGSSQVAKQTQGSPNSISSGSNHGEDDAAVLPPSVSSSISKSQFSETENSQEDSGNSVETEVVAAPRYGSQGPLLASYSNTPKLTPPGSPPSYPPRRTLSKPTSPRRHSISFSSTGSGMFDRSSIYSSMPASYQSSVSSSPAPEMASQSGRTRVDGKEFFRQVRSRLSYEQFGAFLANVKELNSHKQTREETLRKADEIFGVENKDLYTIFEGLITRNLH